jgi:hypothetical protein
MEDDACYRAIEPRDHRFGGRLFVAVTDQYRGRLNGFYNMIFKGGPAVGAAVFGRFAYLTSVSVASVAAAQRSSITSSARTRREVGISGRIFFVVFKFSSNRNLEHVPIELIHSPMAVLVTARRPGRAKREPGPMDTAPLVAPWPWAPAYAGATSRKVVAQDDQNML